MKINPSEIPAMYQQYLGGATLQQIADEHNVSRQRIHQIFQENSLECRSVEVARSLRVYAIQIIPILDYPVTESKGEVINIPMTKGVVAIVDDVDSDLAQYSWTTCQGYGRGTSNETHIFMHRIVLARKLGRLLTDKEEPDHVNLNRADNRRSNLRLATRSQNMQNKRGRKKHGYKGVHWSKKDKLWIAMICVNGKQMYLGSSKDPAIAYDMYCKGALKYHGEFARLD